MFTVQYVVIYLQIDIEFHRLRLFLLMSLLYSSTFHKAVLKSMASSGRLPPLSLPEVLSPAHETSQHGGPLNSAGDAMTPTSLSLALNSPEGINCFGNERLLLHEQSKFYNNEKLSDVKLVVGGSKFYAHKLILVRASDVFERMLVGEWIDSGKKVSKLIIWSESTPLRFIEV